MAHTRLVSPGSCCWNQDCPDYDKGDHGHIVKFGRTKKGTQRYRCKTCKKTFVETTGTVFYGRHHSQETILECLAWRAERNSLAAIHRKCGDTILISAYGPFFSLASAGTGSDPTLLQARQQRLHFPKISCLRLPRWVR